MNLYSLIFVLNEAGYLLVAKNMINRGVHPYWLSSLTGIAAALLILVLAISSGAVTKKEITRQSFVTTLPTGFAFSANVPFGFLALKFITATNYNFLARTNLLLMPLLAFWLLKEKVKPLLFPLLLTMLTGVWFLNQASLEKTSWLGTGLALASALSISFDFIWQKRAAFSLNKNLVAFWRRLTASLIVGVFWILTPGLGRADFNSLPVLGLLSLSLLVLSLCLVKGLSVLKVAEFNLQTTLSPVLTALIGGWWLKESLTLIQLIGAGLIILPIIIYNRSINHYDSRRDSRPQRVKID